MVSFILSPKCLLSPANQHTRYLAEQPDLGAFTTVFRALNHLQPPRSFALPGAGQHSPSLTRITSEADSDAPGRIIAAYLGVTSASEEDEDDDDDDEEQDESVSGSEEDEVSGSGSDTEGEPEGRLVEIEGFSDIDVDVDGQPCLGLEEALSFIAAERARYAAQRDKGLTAESAWKHVVEPKRKRHRKKSKSGSTVTETTTEVTTEATTEDDAGVMSCSSLDIQLTPSFPLHKSAKDPSAKERRLLRKAADAERKLQLLRHSKSTPNLDTLPSGSLDPRIIQLRSLTHKLRLLFPEDSAALSAVLSNNFAGASTRGYIPPPQDTLVHVFIDQWVIPLCLFF